MINRLNIKGVSLIEAMVSLAIFSMALALLYIFYIQGSRIDRFSSEQYQAVESARRGLKTMVKELREASAGDDGSYILSSAEDQEIIFFSDVDADLSTERIRYFLDNTFLKKGTIEPTVDPITYPEAQEQISVIADNVRNNTVAIFTYYNGDYPGDDINNPLPTPTRLIETKLINIYLDINVNPDMAPENIEIQSDVQIRNLKNNL